METRWTEYVTPFKVPSNPHIEMRAIGSGQLGTATQRLSIVPPVVADQISFAMDGSSMLAYMPVGDDGLREIRRYNREGDQLVLKASALYRKTTDNGLERVGDETRH